MPQWSNDLLLLALPVMNGLRLLREIVPICKMEEDTKVR